MVFDQINGLPVHVLVLHAAVVFVPLLVLGSVVYAVVARWRARTGWAVALLAVVAPLTAVVSKLSGTELYERLLGQGMSGPGKVILDNHMNYGKTTMWLSIALGVVSLLLVVVTSRAGSSLPRSADIAFAVVVVGLAAATGYYIFETGDTGATAVWGTY